MTAEASSAAAGSAGSASGAAARTAGEGTSAAFANSLRSAGNDQDDNSADGVGGADNASSAGQSTQPLGQAQINLALAEGSDATGATASALQAANAAASTPPAPLQAPVMPGAATPTVPDGSTSISAIASVPTALPSASGSTGLTSDDSSHTHGGAGDLGAGLGGSGNGNGSDGAAALQQLTSTPTSSSTDSTPPATLRVQAPVDSADFPQGVADRVSFAVDNNWSSAKLQVNPPQLGPIDLQIAVQGDHAQVMMSTHSAVTREALESSLPKLKEMLGSQGFTQVSVDISQRSFQDRSAFSQPYTWTKAASGTPSAAAVAPVSAPSSAVTRASAGVLDAYA